MYGMVSSVDGYPSVDKRARLHPVVERNEPAPFPLVTLAYRSASRL